MSGEGVGPAGGPGQDRDALDEVAWLALKAQEGAAGLAGGRGVERLATAVQMLAGELRELRAAQAAFLKEAAPLREEVRALREEVAALRQQVGKHDGELMMHRPLGPGRHAAPPEGHDEALDQIRQAALAAQKRDPRAHFGGGFGE